MELAIRTAMVKLGGRLLEGLLGIDAGPPRSAGRLRERAPGAVGLLPGQDHRHRGRARAAEPGLVSLRRLPARPGPHGRRTRRRASVAVTRPAQNDRPGGGSGAVRQGRLLLAELAGIDLTVKRVERSAEADGGAAGRAISAEADAIRARQVVLLPPAGPLPDKLYIAVDGTGIPVVAREAEGRRGKADDGKARTREIKMACLFTQTRLDDDGKPARDPASTTCLATFEPADRFGQLVDAETRRRGIEHIRQPVVLGDGAAWIWKIADQHFPAATQIVDLYHAREHLMGIWQATRYASTGRQALRADRGACPPGSRLNGNRLRGRVQTGGIW